MKRFHRIFPVLMVLALPALLAAQKSHDRAVQRNLNTFNAVVKEVELNYIDSTRPDDAFREAIAAYLATIDPYTEFYSEEETEKLTTMTTGEYGGIGAIVRATKNGVVIDEPFAGSPAIKAGLRAGDILLQVDTTKLDKMNVTEVTKLLKGPAGTKFTLKFKRPFVQDSMHSVEITRGKLTVPAVAYADTINGGKTGYISLSSFTDSSDREVREAIDKFREVPGLEGIILDLRGNGGGLLDRAVTILSNFLPKGTEVVRTKYKDSTEKVYRTLHSPTMPDIPLVVLIDQGSASASEITAGALQDLDRAVLVGSRSFGKGLVQSTRPLPYNGLLKVTIAKYYIPSGRLIQALDYSHRNADGSVARVPDSLTKVYKTLHGREVRDGGGLVPDSIVDWGSYTPIVYSLYNGDWLFDYATRFYTQHESIPNPREFRITDEIYADFKSTIDPTKFTYDKTCEKILADLRESAKEEGYLNAESNALLDSLTLHFNHDLNRDLDTHRHQIERYLGGEIVSRYYNSAGRDAYTLRYDPGVEKALQILGDRNLYKRILHKK